MLCPATVAMPPQRFPYRYLIAAGDCPLRHSSFVIHHSSFVLRHSAFILQPSPNASPHPDVSAGLLRHRVRDQSVDEPASAGGGGTGGRAVERAEAAPDRVRGGSLLHGAGAGPARTWSSPPTRRRSSAAGRSSRGSAIRSGRAKRRATSAGSPSTGSRSSTWRPTPFSKGPATPSSAAIRSSPATDCGATCGHTTKSPRSSRCRVIPVELVNPYYYHLDTCFCPLRPGMAI